MWVSAMDSELKAAGDSELKAAGYSDRGYKRLMRLDVFAYRYIGDMWCVEIHIESTRESSGLVIKAHALRLSTAERRALAKLQRVLRREAARFTTIADHLGGK